jgi:YegS/Rv2252/BmrU family lipid kinase
MISISTERQRFICVGGDGTINEIVNSAPCNSNVEFGVIPGGSGNDFVRNFTNHRLFSDIDAQIDGTPASLDLIRCNDNYCVNMINIGFDCSVAKKANEIKSKYKFASPSIAYIIGVVIGFFQKFGTPMKIIFDNGDVIERELTLTAIGNGRFCGGGFMAAPTAELNDGKIDICAINKISRLTFIGLVGQYKAGTFLANPKAMSFIDYRQVSHFKMEFDSPIPICIDGEITSAQTVDFELIPNGFNFVLPKGCEFRFKNKKEPKANENA